MKKKPTKTLQGSFNGLVLHKVDELRIQYFGMLPILCYSFPKNGPFVSRWKIGIQGQLYAPKLGTQYHVTKVTSDDVTMMTSWWNTSGMFIMSKISDMLRHHDVISQ